MKLTAGGFITKFFRDPLPLELTLDYLIFTFVDDSQEKLTTETFMLLFVFLLVGFLLSFVALFIEIWVFKRRRQARIIEMENKKKKTMNKRRRIAFE
jgi:hypothetical protein